MQNNVFLHLPVALAILQCVVLMALPQLQLVVNTAYLAVFENANTALAAMSLVFLR